MVRATEKGSLHLDHYLFRPGRNESCQVFELRFIAEPPGLRVLPQSDCGLRIGLGWQGSLAGTARASFPGGTTVPKGCATQRATLGAGFEPRLVKDSGGLVVEPVLGDYPHGQTDFVVDELSGTTVEKGHLFEDVAQTIVARCAYNPGERLVIAGRITVSELGLNRRGVVFSIRANAAAVQFDNGRTVSRKPRAASRR